MRPRVLYEPRGENKGFSDLSKNGALGKQWKWAAPFREHGNLSGEEAHELDPKPFATRGRGARPPHRPPRRACIGGAVRPVRAPFVLFGCPHGRRGGDRRRGAARRLS